MIKKIKSILNNNFFKIILLILLLLIIIIYLHNKSIEKFTNIENMQKYNVIFAGTIKNADSYIENILNHIDNCGKKFKNYSVIIYENDSEDNTRKLLIDNKKDNYYYIFEDGITEQRRSMRIAHGRNKLLEKMKEINKNDDYTYLIMLDLDDINNSGTFIESIESCFHYEYDDWDVLTGNQKNNYYDIWALRKQGIIDYDCWGELSLSSTTDEKKKEIWHIIGNTTITEKGLVEVDSAFGGIAIYKIKALNNCKYIGEYYNNEYPDHNQKCEHVDFNNCIKQNGGKIFINTDFYTN
jgi:predicted RNA-binding protein with PIN domain